MTTYLVSGWAVVRVEAASENEAVYKANEDDDFENWTVEFTDAEEG